MTEIKYLTVSLTKQEKERIFSRIAAQAVIESLAGNYRDGQRGKEG